MNTTQGRLRDSWFLNRPSGSQPIPPLRLRLCRRYDCELPVWGGIFHQWRIHTAAVHVEGEPVEVDISGVGTVPVVLRMYQCLLQVHAAWWTEEVNMYVGFIYFVYLINSNILEMARGPSQLDLSLGFPSGENFLLPVCSVCTKKWEEPRESSLLLFGFCNLQACVHTLRSICVN